MTMDAPKFNSYRLLTLDGESNWNHWFEVVLAAMSSVDPPLVHATGNAPNVTYVLANSSQALLLILNNVGEEPLALLQGSGPSAQEKWDVLFNEYHGTSGTKTTHLIKEIGTFSMDEQKDLSANVRRMEGLMRDIIISNGGKTIALETLCIAMLLNVVPDEYGATVTVLEADASNDMAKTKKALVAAEKSRANKLGVGFAGSAGGVRGWNKEVPSNPGNPGVDVYCGKTGYKKVECYGACCDPSKNPRNAKCKDCSQWGHRTRYSEKCPKHVKGQTAPVRVPESSKSTPRVTGTPGGSANHTAPALPGAADESGSAAPDEVADEGVQSRTDDDTWGSVGHKALATSHKRTAFGDRTFGYTFVAEGDLDPKDLRHKIAEKSLKRKAEGTPDGVATHPLTKTGRFGEREISEESDEGIGSTYSVSNWKKARRLIDSGCTRTMLQNIADIRNTRSIDYVMSTADGTPMPCPVTGESSFDQVKLDNVLHCPAAREDLLSVSQICDLGFTGTVTAKYFQFKDPKGRIVLTGHRQGGLYVYEDPDAGRAYKASVPSTPTQLAHRRMGHLHIKALRLLSHISNGLVVDNSPEKDCMACIRAKSHLSTFPPSDKRASRIGELVHSDIDVISVTNVIGGYTYFITFLDDYSRYLTVYLLRKKSDAAEAFMAYDARVFNLLQRHITCLRTDNDGSYFNGTVSPYCLKHGIHQESSTRDTPRHNSRSERVNRTLVEGASAVLEDAGLPPKFWGYAVLCLTWLKNRSPHAKIYRMTPYQVWTGLVPDLSNLRVFGCQAEVLLPAKLVSKFSPKTRRMIFVGYSERSKAWVFFDQQKRQEIRCQDAFFLENPEDKIPANYGKTLAEIVYGSEQLPVKQTKYLGLDFSTRSAQETEIPYSDTDTISLPPSESSDDSATEDSLSLAGFVSLGINERNDYYIWAKALSAVSTHLIDTHPTFRQAMAGNDKDNFVAAINKEYNSLMINKVFSEPCALPSGFKTLDTKMVLKIKETEHADEPKKFKARLCVRGFKQVDGLDFDSSNIYAPVAQYNTLRIFLCLLAHLDYEIDCADVITAFLHSPVEEDIYIKIPDGYPGPKGKEGSVLKLLKALYGMKQAPRNWNQELDTFLRSIGFVPTISDRCVYRGMFEGKLCFILLYVDDMLFGTPDRAVLGKLKALVHARFPIEDKGPLSFFLNMRFSRNRSLRTITLQQESKIVKLLADLDMTDCSPSKVPANPDEMLTKEMCPSDTLEIERMAKLPYKSVLGRLLHIALTARPDIATAVSAVGRFAQNPGQKHWEALMRIVKYLKGTRTYGLVLGGIIDEIALNASADADWGGDLEKRRSRTGYTIFMGESLVIWCSKLQISTALSSTEAEYMSLSAVIQDIMWARSLLGELGFEQKLATPVKEDNKACIDIATSRKQHPGTKHIDIRYHFIRDKIIVSREITLVKEATASMVADLFTKQLPFPAFARHRHTLGLRQ